MSKKFLIGQLAYFGDCLYATTVAKQIKSDFPDSHITWAIASKYKSILLLNPYVDKIWEIEIAGNDYYQEGWTTFEAEAKRRQCNGEYDELILTQIVPRWANFDGSIRSSTLGGYPRPITVSVDPVIRLSDTEVSRVNSFSKKHKLLSYKEVILFECSPGSGQSFVDLSFAISVAESIIGKFNDICFILSSPHPLNHPNHQIIDASELTYRENAELTKFCTLLIGCSSGITWLATSDWAKKLNTLQLLNRNNVIYGGVKYDFDIYNISTTNVIEVTVNNTDYVINCVSSILEGGFQIAKQQFDEIYKPTYENYKNVLRFVIQGKGKHKITRIAKITLGHSKRNPQFNILILCYFALLQIVFFYKTKLYDALKYAKRKCFP